MKPSNDNTENRGFPFFLGQYVYAPQSHSVQQIEAINPPKANGTTFTLSDSVGAVSERALRRAQIEAHTAADRDPIEWIEQAKYIRTHPVTRRNERKDVIYRVTPHSRDIKPFYAVVSIPTGAGVFALNSNEGKRRAKRRARKLIYAGQYLCADDHPDLIPERAKICNTRRGHYGYIRDGVILITECSPNYRRKPWTVWKRARTIEEMNRLCDEAHRKREQA